MENKLTNFIPSNKVYMIIITILIAILFINKNFIEGGVALVVFGTLVIYNIKAIKQKKIKWKKYIEDFSSNLNLASKEMLIKFPFPLVLINREGNILWCNENSTKVMKKDNIIGMLFGHTHMEELKVLKDTAGNTVGAEISTPALSTGHGNAPAVKTFYLSR